MGTGLAYRYNKVSKSRFSYELKQQRPHSTREDDDKIINLKEGGLSFEAISSDVGVQKLAIVRIYKVIKPSE